MSDNTLIEQDCASQQIARAIGLFMGAGRKYSVADVSLGTNIPSRTLSGYIASGEDRRTPSADKLLVLMHFFGIEFASKVLGVVGMGAHTLVVKHERPGAVIATLCGATAMIADMAADGVIDHRERAQLEPIADKVIATLQPYATRKAEG